MDDFTHKQAASQQVKDGAYGVSGMECGFG